MATLQQDLSADCVRTPELPLPGIEEEAGGTKECDGLIDRGSETDGLISARTLAINLITGGLGAGILSMPWGIAGASILTSGAICALVLILNFATIMVLIIAGERQQKFDLGALLSCLPGQVGPVSRWITEGIVWVSMWMCLVGYMIIVADSFTDVLPSEDSWWRGGRPVWVSAASAVLIPLCFVDQRWLSFTSTMSVLVNVYLIAVVIGDLACGGTTPGPCLLGFTVGNVTFASNMMFATVIQMCVLPMYRELRDRTPALFARVLGGSFVALWVLFMAFATVAYLRYGGGVDSNVLKAFPHNGFGHSARLGMVLVVLGVYPIMVIPMVDPIRTMEDDAAQPKTVGDPPENVVSEQQTTTGSHVLTPPISPRRAKGAVLSPRQRPQAAPTISERSRLGWRQRWRSSVATVVIVVTAGVAAFWVEDLGTMNVVNGALSGGCFVGVGPALCGWYLCDRNGKAWRAGLVAIFVFVMMLTGFGFAYTDNKSASLEAHCAWRSGSAAADDVDAAPTGVGAG